MNEGTLDDSRIIILRVTTVFEMNRNFDVDYFIG